MDSLFDSRALANASRELMRDSRCLSSSAALNAWSFLRSLMASLLASCALANPSGELMRDSRLAWSSAACFIGSALFLLMRSASFSLFICLASSDMFCRWRCFCSRRIFLFFSSGDIVSSVTSATVLVGPTSVPPASACVPPSPSTISAVVFAVYITARLAYTLTPSVIDISPGSLSPTPKPSLSTSPTGLLCSCESIACFLICNNKAIATAHSLKIIRAQAHSANNTLCSKYG